MAAAAVQVARGQAGSTLTLRLDPGELGGIQVRVERPDGGAPVVHVSVERPETLRLLTADQPQLHRALDEAGLPQDGRGLSLSLAAPGSLAQPVSPVTDQSATGTAPQAPATGGGPQTAGGGSATNDGTGQPSKGSNGGSNGGGNARQRRTRDAQGGGGPVYGSAWQRAGIDITA